MQSGAVVAVSACFGQHDEQNREGDQDIGCCQRKMGIDHVYAFLGDPGSQPWVTMLSNTRGSWGGTFVALFQPGEEVAGGAKAMVEDGLRERIPKPDVAFSQHVLAHPAGMIGTQVGPVLSAGDSIRITLHGKGAHGSMPHNSVDTVVLAAMVVLTMLPMLS